VTQPREKQFLIVNSKVDDDKYEVKLFRNNTENSELFTTFNSIYEAFDYCISVDGGFTFHEDYGKRESVPVPTMHIKIWPGSDIIEIAEETDVYWYGDMSDLDAAIEELTSRDCDWDLVFYGPIMDQSDRSVQSDHPDHSDKANEDSLNPVLESTREMFRKLVMLWELARSEGYEDSNDDSGISSEMFVSAQLAILALKQIYNPVEDHIKAIRRAIREFEELLDFPKLNIAPLELELVKSMDAIGYAKCRFKDGIWYVRTRYEDYEKEAQDLSSKINALLSKKTIADELFLSFMVLAADIIDLLWQDYAKLGYNFYCKHYTSGNWAHDFGLYDFAHDGADEWGLPIGTPGWAEVCIEWVDLEFAQQNLDDWGNYFLTNIEDSGQEALCLLYAWNAEISDEYLTEEAGDWYWPKVDIYDDVDPLISIVQSDPDWISDEAYLNILEFDVTPDLNYILELEKRRGISYAQLSADEKMQLILIAFETLEHPQIGWNKHVLYILSLILSHPDTPTESKALIALLGDEHIKKFGQNEDDDDDED
jgi:hypothetical protein